MAYHKGTVLQVGIPHFLIFFYRICVYQGTRSSNGDVAILIAPVLYGATENFFSYFHFNLFFFTEMEISYEEYGKTAADLSSQVEKLTNTVNQYLLDIIEKSNYQHGCMS